MTVVKLDGGLEQHAFLVGEPACPWCGNETVLGQWLRNEEGVHMHTHYACLFWPSGGRRCGWTGWSVPESEVAS